MMNTAVDLITGDDVPLVGAGRVDVHAAISTTSLLVGDADLVSLNWGVIKLGSDDYVNSTNVTIYNTDVITKEYSSAVIFGTGSITNGINLSAGSMTVHPNSSSSTYVDLIIEAPLIESCYGGYLEEVYGYIVYTNVADSSDVLRIPFYFIPRPYATLTVTDLGLNTKFDGYGEIKHNGPITSSIWAYPVVSVDGKDAGQDDFADVRYVGMDYGWLDGTFGPMMVPAFNTFGSFHTPQPDFAEFDLYMDADNDGYPDFLDFNYNLGWWLGDDDDNTWLVIQVDLATNTLYLGSPYTIYTDFNSGFMEWYLPTMWNSLSADNSDFDFELYVYDYDGDVDFGGEWHFDIDRLPMWATTFGMFLGYDVGPYADWDQLYYTVENTSGYFMTQPSGMIVVDYLGKPGLGEAYYLPIEFDFFEIIFPAIFE